MSSDTLIEQMPPREPNDGWAAWAEHVIGRGIAEDASFIHLDFAGLDHIHARCVVAVRRLAMRWASIGERRVRMLHLDAQVQTAFAFIDMCADPHGSLPITIQTDLDQAGILTITLPELISTESVWVDPRLVNWMDGLTVEALIIDMHHMQQVSSRFITWLLILHKHYPKMTLLAPTSRVESILRQMRLDHLFRISAANDDADLAGTRT